MNKVGEIEILRAFAILAVVAIHTNDFIIWEFNLFFLGPVRQFVKSGSVDLLLRSAVPLFVLISGWVLGLKYKYGFSVIHFYKKRALSIIPQYIIFSFIYILLEHLSAEGHAAPVTISDIAIKLLTGTASPVFWFFVLIIYLYIIYPLLIKFMYGSHSKAGALNVFLYILLSYFCWEFFKSDIEAWINSDQSIKRILGATYRAEIIYHLIFFALGIYISNNMDLIRITLKEQKYIYLCLSIISLFALFKFLRNYYQLPQLYEKIRSIFSRPLLQLAYIYIFYRVSVILVDKTKRLGNIVAVIGKYSFGIYLIHILVLSGVTEIFYMLDRTYFHKKEIYVSAFVLTVLFSIVILKLISFIPYSEFVIGGGIGKTNLMKNKE